MALFEIKHRLSGNVLFSMETESLKLCVEAAVKAQADLSSADLSSADLSHAYLRSADLRSADLRSAVLRYADLSYADLSYADLRYADLRYAVLSQADLRSADLRSADLRSAVLRSADLRSARNISKYITSNLYMFLDQPGKIRAYKLVTKGGYGPWYPEITYKIGQKYEVADCDTDEQSQCGAGINLATLDWCMKEWEPGRRILIAEFEASEIAAIPIGSDGKFRVKSCEIVGEKDLKELGLIKKVKA